jgi:DNA-binding transcriptional ArsR family regulator
MRGIIYIHFLQFDSYFFPNVSQLFLKNILNVVMNSPLKVCVMDSLKNVLYWLIANSLGGFNRGRLLEQLFKKPQNANELSKNLEIEYKTVRYHLKVLEENGILTSVGGGYGKTYFPSENLENNKQYFVEIWDKIGKKSNKE